jgi:hypothetical protein
MLFRPKTLSQCRFYNGLQSFVSSQRSRGRGRFFLVSLAIFVAIFFSPEHDTEQVVTEQVPCYNDSLWADYLRIEPTRLLQ